MYRSQNMCLKQVQLISESDAGRVIVCEDTASAELARYSVFVTSDHELVAKLHRVYSEAENLLPETELKYFSDGGEYLIVFPYVAAREMSRFYMGVHMPLHDCENICKNYVMACITSELPWPVLYLALTQDQVNLARDGSVYLSYSMDLSLLDDTITEKDCVTFCAETILSMCNQKPENVKWDLRDLLEKKRMRQSFEKFTQLYHDVDVASRQSSKKGIFRRIMVWFSDHKDQLFKILLRIAIVLVVFTIITFLTNAIFGDVPWLRLFIRSFERIGTESLVR